MQVGTIAENNHDTVVRRRRRRGIDHHNGKLSQEQVSDIRKRRAAGEKLKMLANEFGVSQALISQIALGKARA